MRGRYSQPLFEEKVLIKSSSRSVLPLAKRHASIPNLHSAHELYTEYRTHHCSELYLPTTLKRFWSVFLL